MHVQAMNIGIGIGAAVIAAIFASEQQSSPRAAEPQCFVTVMSIGTPFAFIDWK
jgi:hypothetical protein